LTIPFLDKRQEKLRTEAAEASAGTGSAGPTRHPTEEMNVDGNGNQPLATVGASGDAEEGKDGKDHGQHPPAKRYRLTDAMKSMVWELVLLSNECCRLENEKKLVFYIPQTCVFAKPDLFLFFLDSSLEGSVIQISDQGLRKVLYQKVLFLFFYIFLYSKPLTRVVDCGCVP
jgi:Ubinuclein conserved middle domain